MNASKHDLGIDDFILGNEGSIWLLEPVSAEAKAWVEEHLPAAAEHILKNTVPHEIAHLIANSRGSRGHSMVWRSICLGLGGNGERCHSLPLPKARRTRRWVYELPRSGRITLSRKKHERLQQLRLGYSITVNATGERVLPEHFVEEVFA